MADHELCMYSLVSGHGADQLGCRTIIIQRKHHLSVCRSPCIFLSRSDPDQLAILRPMGICSPSFLSATRNVLMTVFQFGRMTVNHEKVQVEAKKAAANDPRRQLTTIDLSETTSTWSTASSSVSETSTSHSDSTSPPYPRPLPPSYIPSRSPYVIDLSSHIEEISFNILGVHLSELSPQSSTEERSLPRRMSKTSDYSTRSEEVEMKVIDKQQVEDEKNRSQSEDGEDKDDKKRVSLVPPESPETPEDSCPSP